MEAHNLFFHFWHINASRQGHNPKMIRMLGNNIESVDSDRTGGTENGKLLHKKINHLTAEHAEGTERQIQ